MAAAPRPWLLPPRALLGDNLPLSKHSWALLGLSSIFPLVLATSTGHYVLKASTHMVQAFELQELMLDT